MRSLPARNRYRFQIAASLQSFCPLQSQILSTDLYRYTRWNTFPPGVGTIPLDAIPRLIPAASIDVDISEPVDTTADHI